MSGTKHWISWPEHYLKKGASTYSKSYVSQNFRSGFTGVHGDKNISADKRTQK